MNLDKSENAEEQFECIYCKNDTGSLVTCSSCVPSNAKVHSLEILSFVSKSCSIISVSKIVSSQS